MPLNKENWADYWENDAPICPYCDYVLDMADFEELYRLGRHGIDCPSCGLPFAITTNVSITFSTDEQETGKNKDIIFLDALAEAIGSSEDQTPDEIKAELREEGIDVENMLNRLSAKGEE